MSISKIKTKGNIPIAVDGDANADEQVVYYKSSETPNHDVSNPLHSNRGFSPYHYGDKVIYVTGRRGAGKSCFADKYIDAYVKATDNKVFLVSRFEDDPSLHLPERSLRLSIDDLRELELGDLKNSLVVFDDIHSASYSKQDVNYLQSFILDIIENSRHHNISTLITSHQVTNYQKTRAILHELSNFVLFPDYSNLHQNEYTLKNYFGLKKPMIENIMKVKNSRWVMVQSIKPKFVMTEHDLYTY